MKDTKPDKDAPQEAIVISSPAPLPPVPLSTAQPPEVVLVEAQRAAKALADVLANKKRKVVFNGEQYLEFEDWMLLGRFYGVTARVDRTAYLEFGESCGFEAHASAILTASNQVISAAEAMCLNDERTWSAKPLFQLRSMAQTRACAKALRNVLSWVVVLAGYRPTPAEEMDELTATGAAGSFRQPTRMSSRPSSVSDPPPPPEEETQPPVYEGEPPVETYSLPPTGMKVSDTQLRSLRATARELGWSAEDLKKLKMRYHVEHDRDFLAADYSRILAELHGGAPATGVR